MSDDVDLTEDELAAYSGITSQILQDMDPSADRDRTAYSLRLMFSRVIPDTVEYRTWLAPWVTYDVAEVRRFRNYMVNPHAVPDMLLALRMKYCLMAIAFQIQAEYPTDDVAEWQLVGCRMAKLHEAPF